MKEQRNVTNTAISINATLKKNQLPLLKMSVNLASTNRTVTFQAMAKMEARESHKHYYKRHSSEECDFIHDTPRHFPYIKRLLRFLEEIVS